MEQNVGNKDKVARIVLGALAGVLSIGILANLLPESLSAPEIASPILGAIAIILLGTAFMQKCPLYSGLGVDTS